MGPEVVGPGMEGLGVGDTGFGMGPEVVGPGMGGLGAGGTGFG